MGNIADEAPAGGTEAADGVWRVPPFWPDDSRHTAPAGGERILLPGIRFPAEPGPDAAGPQGGQPLPRTRSGRQMTEAELDELAAEAERGYDLRPLTGDERRAAVAALKRLSGAAAFATGCYLGQVTVHAHNARVRRLIAALQDILLTEEP